MKCKQLALRVLSTAAVMSIVTSVAVPVFADGYGIATYGIYYAEDGNINVSVSDGKYTVNDKEDTDGWVIIKGRRDESDTSAVDNTITINTDKESDIADVTLDNVNIDAGKKDEAALTVTGSGTTTIELNGKNTLTGGYANNSGHAGLEKDDDKGTGKLTIKDDYDDKGNKKSDKQKKAEWETGEGAGSLTATGGVGGAGIGSGDGDYSRNTSNIEIAGGRIEAIGGTNAAGIGTGRCDESSISTVSGIKISGGNVTAVGNDQAAGIGGGYKASVGSEDTVGIEITGGKVDAKTTRGNWSSGYGGAGIGSGYMGGTANIKISGGDVTAESGCGGAGIGGGQTSKGAKIDISGKDTKIKASSTSDLYKGAGIGGGFSGQSGHDIDITISGGEIDASGKNGIGKGEYSYSVKATIRISGGDITAAGASDGAGIGTAASDSSKTTVEITGGTITAIGGRGGYGIGVGKNSESSITVNGRNNSLLLNALGSDEAHTIQNPEDVTAEKLDENCGALVNLKDTSGKLLKAIHNKKYIEETYNNPKDEHQWGHEEILKEAKPGEPGLKRYTCIVDGCGKQTVVFYEYTVPAEPDTPVTPGPDTPTTPGSTETPSVTPAVVVVPAETEQTETPAAEQVSTKTETTETAPRQTAVQTPQKSLIQTGLNRMGAVWLALGGSVLTAAGVLLEAKRRKNH